MSISESGPHGDEGPPIEAHPVLNTLCTSNCEVRSTRPPPKVFQESSASAYGPSSCGYPSSSCLSRWRVVPSEQLPLPTDITVQANVWSCRRISEPATAPAGDAPCRGTRLVLERCAWARPQQPLQSRKTELSEVFVAVQRRRPQGWSGVRVRWRTGPTRRTANFRVLRGTLSLRPGPAPDRAAKQPVLLPGPDYERLLRRRRAIARGSAGCERQRGALAPPSSRWRCRRRCLPQTWASITSSEER